MDDDFVVEYVHGRHTTREYFDRFMMDGAFELAFAGCPTLQRECVAHFWSAFVELDAVPRTDALWARSNMRVTFTKVRHVYVSVPIEESNLEPCWRSFTIALCAGDIDLFGRASEVLLRAGQLSITDFVRTSFNLQGVSGWETDELAAEVPRRAGVADAARAPLNLIIERGPADQAEWAGKVLGRLEVSNGDGGT